MAVLAATLALGLALASPGTSRARPAPAASSENAARARRGLLPRKAVPARAAIRTRRLVAPAAPAWLGDPAGVTEPEIAAGVEPPPAVADAPVAPSDELLAAVIAAPFPAPAPAPLPAAAPAPPAPPAPAGALRAAVVGARVELYVTRRPAAREREGTIRAALTGPEVETVIVRPWR